MQAFPYGQGGDRLSYASLPWISGYLQSDLQSPSGLRSTFVTAGYLGTAQDRERTLLTASGCFPHPQASMFLKGQGQWLQPW